MKKLSIKTIIFWVLTAFLCFELIHGALWDFNLVNKGYVSNVLNHLGYPPYLATILGVTKIIAAIVILSPQFNITKEWAYTGVVILFWGGSASHVFSGDPISTSIWSFAFGIIAILSYVLRPANRKLIPYKPQPQL